MQAKTGEVVTQKTNNLVIQDESDRELSLSLGTWLLRKAIRFFIITALVSLALFTVMGNSGLAFFFFFQFAAIFALPLELTWIGATLVSGIIFTAYYFIINGIYDMSLSICESNFPLKKPAKVDTRTNENSTELKKDVQNHPEKTTIAQFISQVVVGLFSITASLFLAGGAYLGVYTVGEAIAMIWLFQPLAIISAISMFTSMTMFLWPDCMKNAKLIPVVIELGFNTVKATLQNIWYSITNNNKAYQAAQSQHAQQLSFTARFIQVFYGGIMGVFASIGFGAFKLYSTIHVVKLLGVTDPITISIIGGVAFVSMIVQTGFTSGVRIWEKGTQYAREYDGVQNKETTNQQVTINHGLYEFSTAISFLGAVFNGVASLMGMLTLNSFFCALIPTYAFIIQPMLMVATTLVVLSRCVDFWEYYGPFIATSLHGIEVKSITPTLEPAHVDAKKTTSNLNPHTRPELKRTMPENQNKDIISTVSANNFRNPVGTNNKRLPRDTAPNPSKRLEDASFIPSMVKV